MRAFVLAGLTVLHMSAAAETPGVKPQQASGCAPSEGALTTCANLLPARIDTLNTRQVKELQTQLEQLKVGGASIDTSRKSFILCRNWFDSKAEPVALTYIVPNAMKDYPTDGTGQRALVAGIFTVRADRGCHEAKYGVETKDDGWTRTVQFLAITTNPSEPGIKADKKIGSWETWALESRKVGVGGEEWRTRKLDSGAYWQCAVQHPSGSYAMFWGCKQAARAHEIVVQKRFGILGFEDLLTRLMSGKREDVGLRDEIDFNPFEDPAWGRCGGLGCCAAY